MKKTTRDAIVCGLFIIGMFTYLSSCTVSQIITNERQYEFDRLHPQPVRCGGFLEVKCEQRYLNEPVH